MCGIVGYAGPRDCTDVLISALSKLEYRGYDSAGIAVFENGKIAVEKTKGRLKDLEDKMAREHRRWDIVVLAILDGRHMGNRPILIHIRMEIREFPSCIMELLRIILS